MARVHRQLLRLVALASAVGPGCVMRLPPTPTDAAARAAALAAPAAGNPAPAPRVATAPRSAPTAAATPYGPEEAIADALSGPLEVVGVGAWPGSFRRLACVYRNARVFVVDERCSDPREPDGLVIHVLSPARGQVVIFAEAAGPIGGARPGDYRQLGVAMVAPRDPPAPLAISMDYEEVVATETDPPGRVRATCSASTQRPQGSCSKGAPTSPEAYAASVATFLRAPPASLVTLVRALVGLRVLAHAGIRPASMPLPRLAAWGASWARDQEVTVAEEAMKRVGNPNGRTASIALTADGGALIAGTTSRGDQTVPAVVRADARGARLWLKALPDRGFVTHEVASVAALPDGAILLSPGYPDPGWKPTARVVRLDDRGNVRWQWLGRGKDRYKIPQVVTAQPTPQGTILLRGYIQLVADGDVHAWTGELDAKGKAIRDEVGAVLPDHGASFE